MDQTGFERRTFLTQEDVLPLHHRSHKLWSLRPESNWIFRLTRAAHHLLCFGGTLKSGARTEDRTRVSPIPKERTTTVLFRQGPFIPHKLQGKAHFRDTNFWSHHQESNLGNLITSEVYFHYTIVAQTWRQRRESNSWLPVDSGSCYHYTTSAKLLGCLEGFDPSLAASQATVLPLHYRHHKLGGECRIRTNICRPSSPTVLHLRRAPHKLGAK